MKESLDATEWARVRAFVCQYTAQQLLNKFNNVGHLLATMARGREGRVQALNPRLVKEAMKWCKPVEDKP